MLVETIHGPMERDALRAVDTVSESADARILATEWRLGTELVRRDVWVNMYRGITAGSAVGGSA